MVKRAVLIGIDDYKDPRINDLAGCVNDVKAMASLLTGTYAFAPKDVKELTEAPGNTRDGIFAALDKLIEETEAGDVAVVYYSGHGSQVPDVDHDETDGYDETIVPSDSGRSKDYPVRDIVDDELHSYVLALARKTELATFVFDSCHSGSMDRALQTLTAEAASAAPEFAVRAIPPASSRPEVPLRCHPDAPFPCGARESATGLLPQGDYVLIAACKDDELATERQFGDKPDGVLTHFLTTELGAHSNLTLASAFKRIKKKISGQTPVLEGPKAMKSAEPFGGAGTAAKANGAPATDDGGANDDDSEKDKKKAAILEWDPRFASAAGVLLTSILVVFAGAYLALADSSLSGDTGTVRFAAFLTVGLIVAGLLLALTGAYITMLSIRGHSRAAAKDGDASTEKKRGLSDATIKAGAEVIEALTKMPAPRALIVCGALVVGGAIAFAWHGLPTGESEDAPAITRQPTAQSTKVGGKAFFRVTAKSPLPIEYQWERNGNPIPKADKPTYLIESAREGEDEDTITAVVSNADGEAVSDDVTLTVSAGEPESGSGSGG